MKAINSFKALVFVLALTAAPTLVEAQTPSEGKDYQEVSYDDLLTELSSKKAAFKKQTPSPLDTVKIHAGQIGRAHV